MEFLEQLAQLDFACLAVLAAGIGLLGLLIGVADSWRRLQRNAVALPLWSVLEDAGITRRAAEDMAGSRQVRQAELRCMLCARRASCRPALRRPDLPANDCANVRLVSLLLRKTPGPGAMPAPRLT